MMITLFLAINFSSCQEYECTSYDEDGNPIGKCQDFTEKKARELCEKMCDCNNVTCEEK